MSERERMKQIVTGNPVVALLKDEVERMVDYLLSCGVFSPSVADATAPSSEGAEG